MALHACKQKEGQSVCTYVLNMKGYLDQMECLGYPMPLVLSKPKPQARGKGKGKGESKLAYALSKKISPPVKTLHPDKMQSAITVINMDSEGGTVLFIFPEMKKNKAIISGTSCIFTIELYLFPKINSWIYDHGCGTHICNTIQWLIGIWKLNKGALDLYIGNGNRVAVEAIGSFDLILPSGMVLVLENSHFAPFIARGVISLSRLWDNGFL
uniref:Retrovirus-related Pol polyprotein from transposon TNT 1-94-like beta-barrel domain-containing protein n=1 Tax=Tanacetum cinerariifolium TaxID=118510 RepID=A0A6L2JXJ1_TANCI|nr:hypothetical protein [Tanacetum cinerariifolium]